MSDRDRERDRRDYDRRDYDRRDYDRRDRRDYDRRDYDRRDRRDRSRERDRRDRSRERDDDRRKARKRNWDVGADGQTVAPGGFSDAPPGAMMMQQQMMQQMQAQQMNTVLQQQAAVTRRARRLHIGNLPPGLNPAALRELFNDTMKAAKLTLDEEPCVNDVSMNPGPDTKFAFLEFRSAAETNNAMNLDGMQLLGKNIKVSRPNDFMPAPPELLSQIIPAQISATVTSNNPINVPMSGIARPNLPTGVLNPTLNPASVAAAGGVYTCETGSAAAAARTTHTTTNSAAQPPPPLHPPPPPPLPPTHTHSHTHTVRAHTHTHTQCAQACT